MNEEPRSGMQLRDYARVLVRRWVVVAAVTAVVASLLLLSALSSDDSYRSTASVLVNAGAGSSADQAIDPLKQVSMPTEEQLVTSSDVVAFVAKQLRIERTDAAALAKRVGVANPTDTLVLDITCRDSGAQRAQQCADAFADGYLLERGQRLTQTLDDTRSALEADIEAKQQDLDRLARRLARAQGAERSSLLTQQQLLVRQTQGLQDELTGLATVDTDPGRKTVAAKPAKSEGRSLQETLLLGVLIGLVLGVVGAFVVESFDDRVLDADDVERVSGLELLGVVQDRGSYREARSVIAARAPDAHRLLVCAASDTTVLDVTADLAVAFAGLDKHVLIVAGDAADPANVTGLGVPISPGLAELAAGKVSPFAATHPAPSMARVSVLPPGAGGASVPELIATAKGRQALNYVASGFDVTLLGAGSARATGSVDLASACEGVILVATLRSTRLRDIEAAMEKLTRLNAPMLGVLVRRKLGMIQRPRRLSASFVKTPMSSGRRSSTTDAA